MGILMVAGLTLALCACSTHVPSARSVATASHGEPLVVRPTMADDTPLNYNSLHNVVAYHEDFYSGSAPEGDEGFETLVAMGVKTIITVDGAAPDIKMAQKYGMKYIHLPVGYNGFDEQRKLELVRATRDAYVRGPVYIHCHHGKHRSAGAAAAIAQSLGWMNSQEGQARMKVSGTALNYTGLYTCAATSVVLGKDVIDSAPAEFPQVQPPKGLVKSMVEIEEVNDRLKAIEKAGWQTPNVHPDLVPAAEAGRLADLFRDLQKNSGVQHKPEDFLMRLKADEARAKKLEDMLATGEKDQKKMSEELSFLGTSCKDCHAKYRD